jgi:hypothetical protein
VSRSQKLPKGSKFGKGWTKIPRKEEPQKSSGKLEKQANKLLADDGGNSGGNTKAYVLQFHCFFGN